MPQQPEQITVTLPRYQWQALLDEVKPGDMNYTPEGEQLLAAYEAIERAVDPEQERRS